MRSMREDCSNNFVLEFTEPWYAGLPDTRLRVVSEPFLEDDNYVVIVEPIDNETH